MPRKRKVVGTAIGVFGLLALTACGGEAGGDTSSSGESGPETIRVGVIPVSTVAPMYIGVDEGYFEEAGLDVEVVTVQDESAAIASVLSGDLDFAFSTTASIVQAQSKGFPVGVVSGLSQSENTEESTSLLTSAESGITSVSDLEGAEISVNSLHGQSELGIRVAADKAGVPQDSISFVAMPFPEAVTALGANRVNAAGLVAPFSASAENNGAKMIIDDYYQELYPDATTTVWFTSREYSEANSETVQAFDQAIVESYAYAAENDKRVIEELPKYTETPKEVAAELPMQYLVGEINLDSVQFQMEAMDKFGLLEGEPVPIEEFEVDAVKE